MSDDQQRMISRRDLLKRAGMAGAAAAAPAVGFAGAKTADADPVQQASPAPSGSAREALETLTAEESDTLEAIVERLIPADANGPGAKEAHAARYIDRALSGALSGSRDAYRAGLAALDRYARASRGASFHQLSPTDRDSVLIDVELGAATGFPGGSLQFFNMVRTHTIQGTFCDPYYGGNADFVGWDLINYPGIRTTVSAADQQMLERQQLKPNHRSAYDSDMFNKASVSLHTGDMTHGD